MERERAERPGLVSQVRGLACEARWKLGGNRRISRVLDISQLEEDGNERGENVSEMCFLPSESCQSHERRQGLFLLQASVLVIPACGSAAALTAV